MNIYKDLIILLNKNSKKISFFFMKKLFKISFLLKNELKNYIFFKF